MMTTRGLLLDTCAMIWIAQEKPVSIVMKEEVVRVRQARGVLAVSAMSAWEIGMLISKGRIPTSKTAAAWFSEFLANGQITVEPTTPDILIASSYLPRPIHNDPTDRILIATARERDLTIVTRDKAILAYGAAGHVRVLPC